MVGAQYSSFEAVDPLCWNPDHAPCQGQASELSCNPRATLCIIVYHIILYQIILYYITFSGPSVGLLKTPLLSLPETALNPRAFLAYGFHEDDDDEDDSSPSPGAAGQKPAKSRSDL